jgi:hypothetical protein
VSRIDRHHRLETRETALGRDRSRRFWPRDCTVPDLLPASQGFYIVEADNGIKIGWSKLLTHEHKLSSLSLPVK